MPKSRSSLPKNISAGISIQKIDVNANLSSSSDSSLEDVLKVI